jgi:hypothetical protein
VEFWLLYFFFYVFGAFDNKMLVDGCFVSKLDDLVED